MRMARRGIRPELEVFDLGMAHLAHRLLARGLVEPPLYANLMLGFPNSAPADARLARRARSTRCRPAPPWAAAGLGAFQAPANALAIAMGGHVRTGLEDNPWLDARGRRARDERAARRARRHAGRRRSGRAVATPVAARAILGLPTATTPAASAGRARQRTDADRRSRTTRSPAPAAARPTLVTVADHLQRLGHDVWLHSAEHRARERRGGASRPARRRRRAASCPPRPTSCSSRTRSSRASSPRATRARRRSFVAHSDIFDLALPPQLPEVVARGRRPVRPRGAADPRAVRARRGGRAPDPAGRRRALQADPAAARAAARRDDARQLRARRAAGAAAARVRPRGARAAPRRLPRRGRAARRTSSSTTPTSSSARRA